MIQKNLLQEGIAAKIKGCSDAKLPHTMTAKIITDYVIIFLKEHLQEQERVNWDHDEPDTVSQSPEAIRKRDSFV